jgi:hypothetical protein
MSLSPTYFPERDNVDAITSAPFTCWPGCASGGVSVQLPDSLILSAHIATPYPIWLSRIYKGVITLSRRLDSQNNVDVATCTIAINGVSPVYSIATLSIVGAMVFGAPGVYSESGTYDFAPRTVYLNADSTIPLYTGKVMSLADVNGNKATGQVTLTPGPGALITGNPDNSLTISFPFPTPTSSPFKYLVIQIFNNTLVNVAYDQGNVNLDYAGASLDALCVSRKVNELPDSEGNLPKYPYNPAADDPPTPAVPPVPSSTIKHTITRPLSETQGAITITGVSGPGYRSRLSVNRTGDSEITMSLLG